MTTERLSLRLTTRATPAATCLAAVCLLVSGRPILCPAQEPVAPATAADTAEPNDIARYLAGLPIPPRSEIGSLGNLPALEEHRKDLDRLWGAMDNQRLDRVRAWSNAHVRPKVNPRAPLVYLFGGPDLLWAMAMYPEASTFVLAGLEPVGSVLDPRSLGPDDHGPALSDLRSALRGLLRKGFFETKEMREQLAGKRFEGVLPMLLVFAVRSGYAVEGYHYVDVTSAGEVRALTSPAKATGVRVFIRTPLTRQSQEVLYFKTDLSDSGIKGSPGFMNYVQSLGPCNAYIKAASYLLHRDAFSRSRKYLLTHSASVLQDDSGIPFRLFDRGVWDIHLFGKYAGTMTTFAEYEQADLDAAFKAGNVGPLTFGTGYRLRDSDSNQMLAVRRATPERNVEEVRRAEPVR